MLTAVPSPDQVKAGAGTTLTNLGALETFPCQVRARDRDTIDQLGGPSDLPLPGQDSNHDKTATMTRQQP